MPIHEMSCVGGSGIKGFDLQMSRLKKQFAESETRRLIEARQQRLNKGGDSPK
jgi:hypothetical protein